MVALIPEVTIPQAMIIGAMLGFVVTWGNAQEISKSFLRAWVTRMEK